MHYPSAPIIQTTAGFTKRGPHDGMRILIALNDVRLLLDTWASVEMIVEVLVHEMIVSQNQFIGRVFEGIC